MEFLTDGGWVSNGVLAFIVVGYTFVGLVFGAALGYERAERKGYERQRSALADARRYWEQEQEREFARYRA